MTHGKPCATIPLMAFHNKHYCVYVLLARGVPFYVGITTMQVGRRVTFHKTKAKRGYRGLLNQRLRWLVRKGIEVEAVERRRADSADLARMMETQLIQHLRTGFWEGGCNILLPDRQFGKARET